MLNVIFIFIFFLCIGSFINVISCRITAGKNFFTPRSECMQCSKKLAWYDLIPVVSWIILKAKCRHCHQPISYLYPLMEVFSGVILTGLFFRSFVFDSTGFSGHIGEFVSHIVLITALLCATRSDLEALVIPQAFTLWMLPFGFLFSFLGFNGVSLYGSVLGAALGYFSLWIIAKAFYKLTGKYGLGEGDMELMALIGSFLGPLGVYFSITVGSILGLVVGGTYIIISKKTRCTLIPFGPFLALGATIYLFFSDWLDKVF